MVSPLRSFLVSSPYQSHSSYGNLSAREALPVFGRCQVRLSVLRVLVECSVYSVPRNRFFPSLTSVPSLSESPNFSPSILFTCLRVSGLMSDL